MGANQSSKSRVDGSRRASTGEFRPPSSGNLKLSASLRRGVNHMFNKQQQKSDLKGQHNSKGNDPLDKGYNKQYNAVRQSDQLDPGTLKQEHNLITPLGANGSMNDYVTMHQKQQQQRISIDREQQLHMAARSANRLASQGNYYVATDLISDQSPHAMGINMQQPSKILRARENQHNGSPAKPQQQQQTMITDSRSQQHGYGSGTNFSTKATGSFQLAKAVNTKTSNLLGGKSGSVAMPSNGSLGLNSNGVANSHSNGNSSGSSANGSANKQGQSLVMTPQQLANRKTANNNATNSPASSAKLSVHPQTNQQQKQLVERQTLDPSSSLHVYGHKVRPNQICNSNQNNGNNIYVESEISKLAGENISYSEAYVGHEALDNQNPYTYQQANYYQQPYHHNQNHHEDNQQLNPQIRQQHLVGHPIQAIDFHQTYYQATDNRNYPGAVFGSGFLAAKGQHFNRHLNQHINMNFDHNSNSYKAYDANNRFGFGSSHTIGTKSKYKFHNPLSSIFNSSSSNQHNSLVDDHQARLRHHSNTIHLARSNKSSQNLTSLNYYTSNGSKQNQRSFSSSLKRIKSTPLSAQQASYEAMRTIDMYLIRQIARSCMDFEMEQKIDLEIRLRELAAQSMLEARNEIDILEVEKSLLASDQRMNCYASQLELQRKKLSNPSLSTDSGRGSKSGSSRPRSDVIGSTTGSHASSNRPAGQPDTSSPSFSSLSNSQSPSKMSPVSGESAAGSQPSFASSGNPPSRTGAYRLSKSSTSGNNSNNNNANANQTNTLNSKRRTKNKKRDQLMQSIASYSNINCNMVVHNKASVSVSEIRVPLMWRDVDHFKGRGDYKRFAAFCLLRIDSQIYDTQLISDLDRQCTDITFDDVVVFNDIDHAFELTLEVYSCVYLEQFSLSSTPRKLKEKLTSSVSRAMGRKLAIQTASSKYTKELQAYDKSYRFAMIASATLRLEDASDSVKTYDLALASPSAHNRHQTAGQNLDLDPTSDHQYNPMAANSMSRNISMGIYANTKEAQKNTLPLFGHFCCRLSVKPHVFDRNIKTGYLKVATIGNQYPDNANSPDRLLSSGNTKTDSPGSNTPSGGYESGESAYNSRTKMHSVLMASNKLATLSMTNSTLHWVLLRNFTLHLWPIDDLDCSAVISGEPPCIEDPTGKQAPLIVNINRYTRLLRVSNSSLTIEADNRCFVLSTYCPEAGLVNPANEIGNWLRVIEQQIFDSHIWSSVLNHYPPHARQSQYATNEDPATISRNATTYDINSNSDSNYRTNFEHSYNYDPQHNALNLSYMSSSSQFDHGCSKTSTSANYLQANL